jgi:hypothetical protein
MAVNRAVPVLFLAAACAGGATEPCAENPPSPVLAIVQATNQLTGQQIDGVIIRDVRLEGVPVDTVDLPTNLLRNVERVRSGLRCILPCAFGVDEGSYAFGVSALGYYPTSVEVFARYADIPFGCPAAHGTPTPVEIRMIEADSARVSFNYATRRGTGIGSEAVSVTFDDGSGPRTIQLRHGMEPFVTRNAGTLIVRVAILAPDTIAVGDLQLPLKKDWIWGIGVYLYDRSPLYESFCIQAKSFALRRPVPGADSLYLGWGGAPLSILTAC